MTEGYDVKQLPMEKKMGKKITDTGILVIATILAVIIAVTQTVWWRWPLFALLMLIAIVALNDLLNQSIPRSREKKYGNGEGQDEAIRELILLDEEEKPIKSWDLTGRISLLIGREHPEEQVDVDLEESEYSAFIDYQHAVLNYCMDAWFIEDLNSHNGIRIRKIEDGICYKMMKNRPCRLMPGDMIYIANTKLLIT